MLLPAYSSERRLPTGKDAAMAWVAAVLAAVAQNSVVLAEMVERAAFLDTGPPRGEKPLLSGGSSLVPPVLTGVSGSTRD